MPLLYSHNQYYFTLPPVIKFTFLPIILLGEIEDSIGNLPLLEDK